MIKSKSHRESSFCVIQNNLKKQIQKMNKIKNINDNLSHKIYVNKKIYTHSKKMNDLKKTTFDTNTTTNTSTSIERNSLSKIPLSPFSFNSPKITQNNLSNKKLFQYSKLNNFFTPKKYSETTIQYSGLMKNKINKKNNNSEKKENENIIHNENNINNIKPSVAKILNFIKKKKSFELSFTSPNGKNQNSNNISIEASFFKNDCKLNTEENNKIKEENEDYILITDSNMNTMNTYQFEESDLIKNVNFDSINISNTNYTNNTINSNNNNFKNCNDLRIEKKCFSPKNTIHSYGLNQLMKLSNNINDIKYNKKTPIRNFNSFSGQKILIDNPMNDPNPFSINNISDLIDNNYKTSFFENQTNAKNMKKQIKKKLSRNKFTNFIYQNIKEKKKNEFSNKVNTHNSKKQRNKTEIFKIHNNTLCLSNKLSINNINSINKNSNKTLEGKIENYILGKELGKGSFASVRSAINKITKQKYAIKIYPKINLLNLEKRNSIKNEISVLKQLNHENIMKLYEVIDSPKNIYLVLEYIKGISLSDYIKTFSEIRINEDKCKKIYYQIVKAINYCKLKNIYHRDIKLENILLIDEKIVKIIDFGFSIKCPKKSYQKFLCGTPTYMAPEIINKNHYIPEYSDIWSLGVLLYIMLTGNFPFNANTEDELCKKINKCDFDIPDYLSVESRNLIRKIFIFEPSKRISTENILIDEWFQNICE